MAAVQMVKLTQIAKDLGLKSKTVGDTLAEAGIEVKTTQKALDAFELDVLWERLTLANQITNIEDYIDGITAIPSAKPKEEAKVEPEKVEEKKPEPKAEEKKDAEKKPEAPKHTQIRQTPNVSQARSANERFADRQNKSEQQSKNGGQGQKKQEQKPKKNEQARQGMPMRELTRPEEQREKVIVNKGNLRTVDTRASSVDLSKYDEKLDNIAPDMGDAHQSSQKIKKNVAQNGEREGGTQKGSQNQKNGRQQQKQQPQQGSKNDRRQQNDFAKGGKNQKGKKGQPQPQQPIKKQPVKATVPEEITVGEFAQRIKVASGEVVKRLMLMGMMVTVNQTIDFDTAYLVADELGAEITKEVVVSIEEKLFDTAEDGEGDLIERAPVVCVMGHVDHGKTSLLDAIRNTHVTAGEAGGITQHIGAYRVKVKGKDITFLDTPGHEAFTAMRARGAQATDIAILVVAADDGIMPQTVEAINHAKAAGVEIIVAINKMDKPGANPDNIKSELTKYDLVPEEWGGNIMCVPVSALKHQGIDDLLESVLLIAEVNEYKANPSRRAKGIVIESKLDRGRGPVATVLVQNGTLKSGDIVIAGTAVGRIRAMTDHMGRSVKAATPSMPVEIIGLSDVPFAGDEFNAVEDEKMARELAERRRSDAKEETFKANARASLNDLFAQISEGAKELNIIVKADVGGSAEAVRQSLEKISNDEVKVKVIHAAAGGITEGDITFAAASNAIIVGFNVRPDKATTDSAEKQGVEIRTYRVIYDCIDEITAAMKGMLAPKTRENVLGHAEIRQVIHISNVGFIAGCYVLDGKITRSAQIRVLRDSIVIADDKLASLRRFKDDVREVAEGYECGMGLTKFNDLKTGDILEAYVIEEFSED